MAAIANLFALHASAIKKTSPWELMDPWTKNDSDKTQDIRIPFDPLTAHKIDILIKQLLCQFEGLLVF